LTVLAQTEWSSLEIAKLAVGALVPILLFTLGISVTRAARRVEDAQWASRKLIEHRLTIYERMAPKLNDLLCFFGLFGQFKEVTPPEALKRKRDLDREFFARKALFSQDFAADYAAFIDACFMPYTEVGHDARFRTSPVRQKKERSRTATWDDHWRDMFAPEAEWTSFAEIRARYDTLMERFAVEVGVRGPHRSPVGRSSARQSGAQAGQ
jgi:hypothetical protein